jgi:hypothetical protein
VTSISTQLMIRENHKRLVLPRIINEINKITGKGINADDFIDLSRTDSIISSEGKSAEIYHIFHSLDKLEQVLQRVIELDCPYLKLSAFIQLPFFREVGLLKMNFADAVTNSIKLVKEYEMVIIYMEDKSTGLLVNIDTIDIEVELWGSPMCSDWEIAMKTIRNV